MLRAHTGLATLEADIGREGHGASCSKLRQHRAKDFGKLAAKLRAAVRKVADHTVELSSSSNAAQAYVDWESGFRFADDLPKGTLVEAWMPKGAKTACFLHKEETLLKVDGVIAKLRQELLELVKLSHVDEVMRA